MICSLDHLNSAIDWLERAQVPKVISAMTVAAEHRGWSIVFEGRFGYGLANQAVRLDVAPWVVDEVKQRASQRDGVDVEVEFTRAQ